MTVLNWVVVLLLAAGSAAATPYRVVSGTVLERESGDEEPLGGSFEISPFVSDATMVSNSFLIDDFLLEFAGESFTPRVPVEFNGLRAIDLRIADHIQFDGDAVRFAFFQAGGDLIEADESQVGFRFLEFRAEGPRAGVLIGRDPAQPRRIVLSGSLAETDQYYRIPSDECRVRPLPIPQPPPIDGGGIIIVGDRGDVTIVQNDEGGVIHRFEEFDLAADETVDFRRPDGSIVIQRVIGEGRSTIEGEIVGGSEIVIANPFGTGLLPTEVGIVLVPTLEELGISAPDGAVVTYDGSELTVSTAGDLFIDGGLWDLPGLSTVRLEAGGDIIIQGTLELPSDTTLHVDAGGSLSGGLVIGPVPPGDILVPGPPIGVPLCNLLPIFPAERRELGELTLVLSAAQLVEVDVRPHRVVPISRGSLRVVIHGSSELDVRDVDVESLRFGVGEALFVARGRVEPGYLDANRDGTTDVIVRFRVRDAEIAFGDTEVCLFGETTDGTSIEGCDEISTRLRVRNQRRAHRTRKRR